MDMNRLTQKSQGAVPDGAVIRVGLRDDELLVAHEQPAATAGAVV